MKLYLVRHGQALSDEVDPTRHLSLHGIAEVTAMGKFLAEKGILSLQLFHSGIMRARQTAEILALALGGTVAVQSDMKPDDDISTLIEEIKHYSDDTMLVGHLPFLCRLLAKLVIGNEGHDIVNMHTACVVCLEKVTTQRWLVEWVISPRLIL